MGDTTLRGSTDRLLRTDEVATWLAVSKSTLVRWRQSGRGPAVCWLAGRSAGHATSRGERGRAYASR